MKFCAFLFAAMMASASAFAPSSKATSTTALNQAIDYNPNLGGATSNDPVDQTLMNMVRSVSCCIASNADVFPRRSNPIQSGLIGTTGIFSHAFCSSSDR